MPTWEISRIKGTPAAILGRASLGAHSWAHILGRISALTAQRAVEEWVEKFGITDEHQKTRLVARPVK